MASEALCRRLTRLTLNRTFSTTRCLASAPSNAEPDFTAAPPIDLDAINPMQLVQEAAQPPSTDARQPAPQDASQPPALTQQAFSRLRIVPASRSYFTSTPRFIDDYLHAAALLARFAHLPTATLERLPQYKWTTHEIYRNGLSESVKPTRFLVMMTMLRRLALINPSVMPAEVDALLARFRSRRDKVVSNTKPILIDKHGRARAVGRRKDASAVVYLVEGLGEVRVNGKTLAQAFPRHHDRESAIWPLMVTQRVDKYNVWAVVKGGGTTGQAEAMTLGIARALTAMEPGLKPFLRKAGVMTRDPRMVERKKPGKRGARKMPAWVKR